MQSTWHWQLLQTFDVLRPAPEWLAAPDVLKVPYEVFSNIDIYVKGSFESGSLDSELGITASYDFHEAGVVGHLTTDIRTYDTSKQSPYRRLPVSCSSVPIQLRRTVGVDVSE